MSDRPGPGACRQTTRTHTTAAAEEEGQGGRQQQGHKPPLGRDSRTWGPHTDAALNFLIFPIQVQSSTDDPRTPIEENDEGKKSSIFLTCQGTSTQRTDIGGAA